MKQKLGRKLIGFLLTLAIVVGLLPGMSLTARADTALPTDGSDAGNGLKYFVGFINANRDAEPVLDWNLPASNLVDGTNNKICWAFTDVNGLSQLNITFEAKNAFSPKKYYLRTADGAGEIYANRNTKSWTISAKLNSGDEWEKIADVKDYSSMPASAYTPVAFDFSNS